MQPKNIKLKFWKWNEKGLGLTPLFGDRRGFKPAQLNTNKQVWFILHLISISDFFTELQFQLENPSHPDSVCSLPCGHGKVKKHVEGESCCWTCHNCGTYQVSIDFVNYNRFDTVQYELQVNNHEIVVFLF